MDFKYNTDTLKQFLRYYLVIMSAMIIYIFGVFMGQLNIDKTKVTQLESKEAINTAPIGATFKTYCIKGTPIVQTAFSMHILKATCE